MNNVAQLQSHIWRLKLQLHVVEKKMSQLQLQLHSLTVITVELQLSLQ